jgi:hypothetical protein
VDEAKSTQIGFAHRPFDRTTRSVSDGHNAAMANSAFGAIFSVADAVAGTRLRRVSRHLFFDYRRRPGQRLHVPSPRQVPIGRDRRHRRHIAFCRQPCLGHEHAGALFVVANVGVKMADHDRVKSAVPCRDVPGLPRSALCHGVGAACLIPLRLERRRPGQA